MGNCISSTETDEELNPDDSPPTESDCRQRSGTLRPSGEHIRLFLIGNGEVGKSTLVKQMQNLCLTVKGYAMFDENWNQMQPFSDEDRRNFSLKIHQNVFRMIGTLIGQVDRLGMHYSCSEYDKFAREIQNVHGDLDTLYQRDIHLTPQTAEKIGTLWTKDSGIREAWSRRREFLISDSAEYFLHPSKLCQIAQPSYVPSIEDTLRVRDPTTGIRDYNFRVHKVYFTVHDMGGQPVERARLPTYLDSWLGRTRPGDRNFVLYVAALSDYNQRHPTYQDRTVLDESIQLLKILLDMRQLRQAGFILFLNKRDIFEQKLHTFKDFHHYFGEYLTSSDLSTDRPLSLSQAEKVVASRFADAVNRTARPDEQLYCRFTTAIDRDMMETIFHTVKNDIINEIIKHDEFVPFP